jgi:hypothetical protein
MELEIALISEKKISLFCMTGRALTNVDRGLE